MTAKLDHGLRVILLAALLNSGPGVAAAQLNSDIDENSPIRLRDRGTVEQGEASEIKDIATILVQLHGVWTTSDARCPERKPRPKAPASW